MNQVIKKKLEHTSNGEDEFGLSGEVLLGLKAEAEQFQLTGVPSYGLTDYVSAFYTHKSHPCFQDSLSSQ